MWQDDDKDHNSDNNCNNDYNVHDDMILTMIKRQPGMEPQYDTKFPKHFHMPWTFILTELQGVSIVYLRDK